MGNEERSLIKAVRAVYEALEPLDEEERDRTLASARALLGMTSTQPPGPPTSEVPSSEVTEGPIVSTTRPLSLMELMQQRNPTTNPERIALFAYYRERVEDKTRFSRGDLKDYFPRAHLSPPANYDRDFTTAVKYGWIHEDGAESYLTTKGIEAVESSFSSGIPPAPKQKARGRLAGIAKAKARSKTSKGSKRALSRKSKAGPAKRGRVSTTKKRTS